METAHKDPQKIRQFPQFWTMEFDLSAKTPKKPHVQGDSANGRAGIPTKRAVLMSESSSMGG